MMMMRPEWVESYECRVAEYYDVITGEWAWGCVGWLELGLVHVELSESEVK